MTTIREWSHCHLFLEASIQVLQIPCTEMPTAAPHTVARLWRRTLQTKKVEHVAHASGQAVEAAVNHVEHVFDGLLLMLCNSSKTQALEHVLVEERPHFRTRLLAAVHNNPKDNK